jgi:hypothetical protein
MTVVNTSTRSSTRPRWTPSCRSARSSRSARHSSSSRASAARRSATCGSGDRGRVDRAVREPPQPPSACDAGFYEDRPYETAPLLARAATRSLAASAPDDPAVFPLLANSDPTRFDDLYAALAPETRALVEELSPFSRIGAVTAPIEIASSPADPFFPVEESLALAEAGRDVRLTVTPALFHVTPCLRPGLVRVVALLDRTLRHASQAEPALVLTPSVA